MKKTSFISYLLVAALLITAVLSVVGCDEIKVSLDVPSTPTGLPIPVPTQAPTAEPTEAPTAEPTEAPTAEPTEAPTVEPTEAPTAEPTEAPTAEPTEAPTSAPTEAPTDEYPVPPSPPETTVADILAGEIGNYTVDGYVVGYNAQSFLLSDGTGMILVYKGNTWTPDVKVGYSVTVSGDTTVYGGAKQFGTAATYEITNSVPNGYTHPEPVELTVEQLNAYSTANPVSPLFVKIKGILQVSGNYFNLLIDGSSMVGSISYPVAEFKDVITQMDGQYIEIIGYVTNVTGSGKYLNVMTATVTVLDNEPPAVTPPTEMTISEILAAEFGKYATDGVVTAINSQSFIISDGVGSIMVYRGGGRTPDVKLGDNIHVEGVTTSHAGGTQFHLDATYTATPGEEMTLPTPTELWGADFDAILGDGIARYDYIKITGTLTVSGNYYNIAVDGATLMGSVSYPDEPAKAALQALDGTVISVTGYVTGFTGGNKYVNIFMTHLGKAPDIPGDPTDPTEPIDPPTPDGTSISDVLAGALGNYTVEGTVVGVNAQSFLLSDGTGMILVYKGNTWTPDVYVGDVVSVSGETSSYGGAKQFGATTTYEVTGTAEVTYPSPKSLYQQRLDEYASVTNVIPEYVTLIGTLTVSGNYYNLTVGTATVKGSFSYPTEEQKALLAELNGAVISVTGYVTNITGGGKFLSILVTEFHRCDDPVEDPVVPPTEEPVVPPTEEPAINYGTFDDPISASEALEACKNLASGQASQDMFFVTGTVESIGEFTSFYKNVYISDGTSSLLIYTASLEEGVSTISVGDTVIVHGYIKNYSGTIEMATVDGNYVYIVAVDKAQ